VAPQLTPSIKETLRFIPLWDFVSFVVDDLKLMNLGLMNLGLMNLGFMNLGFMT
jgi:hypothetical protein